MRKSLFLAFMLCAAVAVAQYTVTPGRATAGDDTMTDEQRRGIIDTLIDNMVDVKGGTFMMGATPDQGDLVMDDEKPAHQVTLSDFKIGRFEVTQREWQAVMGNEKMKDFGMSGPFMPMYAVTWYDCQEFIKRLNNLTGHHFRLPTEAEWEYAARGGQKSHGTLYAGSNKIEEVAWTHGTIDMFPLTSVGRKAPNELGLYDMSGHVSEWCSDWDGPYSDKPQTNPKGAASSKYKVRRGGSHSTIKAACRCAARMASTPDSRSTSIGFRLVESK